MGRRIDCYLDVASFYSYVAFADLLNNMEKLAANDVQVEFHPVLIAGVMKISGNRPPWVLPAKGLYLNDDLFRSARRVGKPNVRSPPEFQSISMTVSPIRALHYIKANYDGATFVSALHFLFERFWTPPHSNLTQDDQLAAVLLEATETPEGGKKLFTEGDVKSIMDARDSMKESVKKLTSEAIGKGAFGMPWIMATNDKGKSVAFFGSDRFNHIYQHLEIAFRDIEVLTPHL